MQMTFTCAGCGRAVVVADLVDTYGSRLAMLCGGPRASQHSEMRMDELPAIDPSLSNVSVTPV